MADLYTEVPFPEEDYAWLEREAKRRKITPQELVDELLGGEFVIDVPRGGWTEAQMREHLNLRILHAVHQARLGYMAMSN